ncbi:MAG: hypothetical protein NC204_01965 [Candidatus Amulumruptor caecigallinarius]|nr:hypothetical protein [Candidatus Amulumruptor caecigallinarius]
MKLIMLFAALTAMSIPGFAKLELKSVEVGDATNMMLIDEDAGNSVDLSKAVIFNNGKEYYATGVKCGLKDGTATYEVKFKKFNGFKDARVVLTVNGEELEALIPDNNPDAAAETKTVEKTDSEPKDGKVYLFTPTDNDITKHTERNTGTENANSK